MPLIVQIIVISIGGYAVFRISQIKLSSTTAAIILELIYFLYPATYGFMANGANYMCYLESFILIGYLFYNKKMYFAALIFFFLASITDLWGTLIVMVFIFFDVLSNSKITDFIKIHKNPKLSILLYIKNVRENSKPEIYFLISTFIIEITIFSIVIYLAHGIVSAFGDSRLQFSISNLNGNSSNNILANFFSGLGTVKLQFLNEVLTPFLYLPLFTLYIIPVLIYIVITWTINPNITSVYEVLPQHYSYLFASFLIVGTIHFFKTLGKDQRGKKIGNRLLVLILISSLVSFALYSPFSINNFESGQISKSTHISQFDRELNYGISLIPLNSSVFLQNDLPQLMNRYQVYMPGYYQNQSVDYAVIIPFGFSQISDAYSGYSLYWADHFQNNSSYGLFENIGGAYIYKLNYVGNPVYFVPLTYYIAPGVNGLEPRNSASTINNSIVASNITIGQTLWCGGFSNLYPGTFNVTFQLETSNLNKNNSVNLYTLINSNNNTIIFGQKVINGSNFSQVNKWENFTVTFAIKNFYSGLGIQYQGSSSQWIGMLKLKSIVVEQT